MNRYPLNWRELATAVKTAARWRCIRCEQPNQPATGHTLTVHHWDGDTTNRRWWNLMALCQRCHLSIKGRVDPHQAYMFEHSDWCKPYAAGLYAAKYLGLELTRDEVMARLDELRDLERKA